MPKKRKINPKDTDRRMVDLVDRLIEFEKFEDEVLPALRKDMYSGMSAIDIYKKWSSLAAARGVSIALGSTDEAKALAAINETINRAEGKATEKKEVTHKYEGLSDEELEALIETLQKDSKSDDDNDEKQPIQKQ